MDDNILMARPIPISNIDVDMGWNSRSEADVHDSSNVQAESAGLRGLIANLRAVGQTTPVDVRSTEAPFYRETNGKPFSLLTGFRRVTALIRIYEKGGHVPGLPAGHVLTIDRGKLDEREAFLVNARENTNREGLAPPDTCLLIKRGIEHGFSPERLAEHLGFTLKTVMSYRRVAELPGNIFAHWHSGGIVDGSVRKKRLGIAEMIAVTRATDPAEAYAKALRYSASQERRTARAETANARAVAIAVQLAQFAKRGMFTMKPEAPWIMCVDVAIGPELTKGLQLSEAEDLARAAKQAFEAEMALPTPAEEFDDSYDDDSFDD
jgi:ParB-like chromosome segregation protein Spo0J